MDMSIVFSSFILLSTISTSFLAAQITPVTSPALLHPDELKALEEIASTLGITKLNLGNGDPCDLKRLKIDVAQDPTSENIIVCDCSRNNTCHITDLTLKTLGLPGIVPPELVKLQYLRSIDLCRNYLSGSIPMEWASMPELISISVCANNLSGPLPTGLQNFKKLKFLGVEANQFSGHIPAELGNLISLTRLQLGSNQFTSTLPTTLSKLVNLKEFRISDNKFNGIIPRFIGDWSRLEKIHLFASGLKGPIPDALARLENLVDLTISDMTGINSFPNISSKSMNTLILRNLSLSGQIPSFVWSMPVLETLDVSFNKLSGEVDLQGKVPKYTYLNDNMLSGNVGSGAFLNNESYIDLSYNNFSYPSSCPDKRTGLLPCASPIKCNYQRSLHINCGGDKVVITNSSHKITYQADNNETKAATNQHFENWGVSSTGYLSNDIYIITPTFALPENSPAFYKSARQSLVYYAFCLENGAYNVKLHFMEIQFSNEEPYSRLGRRIFDIYLQGELFKRDFNIKEEANGTRKPILKEANVNVANHLLEIRLYWAGKGTTLIPQRWNYGPIISAISLCHSSLGPGCGAEKTIHRTNYLLIFGITGALLAVMLLALGLYAQKRCRGDKNTRERDLRAQGLQTVCFTWRQLQAATNNFDEAKKLGEGGFGSVFKGELSDGTIIAVKQLSAKSCQGNREFVNEIGMISGLNHPNLVKLYGCCVEKNQLLLVYEYMENNSLALALNGESAPNLDWAVRQRICVGIARGLEFLHEGSMIRMVHRDIKTTNVLLDADLNAKISDFGLARLHEEEHTHISTKIAGTIGYMAPEYALYGELTEKADVFSFGVVAMEIVSGKSNTKQKGSADHVWLIKWARKLQQTGDIMDIIDPVLEGDFNRKEAERMIKVSLVCTNSSPLLRPTMSEVVQMLEGEIEITQVLSDPGLYEHNFSISKPRGTDTHGSSSTSGLTDQTETTMKSSVSSTDLYPLYPESMILNSTVDFSSSAF
ncbi:PREDICTED: probable LRR receptor-like serine/threonine-protein kinase At1g29720 isoform X2 [Brassica oleracea var. oleracea]|uniref:probable LRR receptor-like serine/threonine-protein kinase At1g29720 isoform X2 n=1 Tax=Brassica oleracea var. oleracea TaxID=109376 RepID=UPI0006A73004|nr:PREDICTED: probable LRR receptor-like serine/threonine-protein kinase At1g29720 isoform X2 [Brassica oleracea var. oleracea]